MRRFFLSVITTLLWCALALSATAQPTARLWNDVTPAASRRPDITIKRRGTVRPNPSALVAPRIEVTLLDGSSIIFTRTKDETPRANTRVWTGKAESGQYATLSIVNGVLTGTVFDRQSVYEIIPDDNGYAIVETDPTAYPTDDGLVESEGDLLGAATTGTSVAAGDGTTVIDVMVVWTPAAAAAVGGVDAIQSRIVNAIANANLVYSNSLLPVSLRLVHSAPVSFTETVITTDLSNLRGTTDGILDDIHALRTQVGADIVSLFGNGYRTAGYCGYGSIMTSIGTGFAPFAFNVVDQSCAVSNLSFAHEVGHNQGLHHDPANASSAGATSYAYGYQEPTGLFRTVLSYGSATRIPYLSSPTLLYNGVPTGTATQDNARALALTAATVASFRTDPTAPTPTPTCTYTLTPTSLSYTISGGARSVSVATQSGCAWTVSGATSWIGVGPVSGTGPGSFVVTVGSTTANRSATLSVAGVSVRVAQTTKRR